MVCGCTIRLSGYLALCHDFLSLVFMGCHTLRGGAAFLLVRWSVSGYLVLVFGVWGLVDMLLGETFEIAEGRAVGLFLRRGASGFDLEVAQADTLGMIR